MRAIFTAGVLDVWAEKGLYFPHIAAVSAGTLQALSYLSRQPGRNIEVNTAYCADPRYMGVRHLWKKQGYFNFDFIFGELSHKLLPFDYDAFGKAQETLYVAATNCLTGKPDYFCSKEYSPEDFMTCCQASCSMPLFCRLVYIRGVPYADGGPSTPVAPMPEELPFSGVRPVYVLTRDETYRKKEQPRVLKLLAERVYRRYPALLDAMDTLAERYNQRAAELARREAAGDVFILRPSSPVKVRRNESHPDKLRALYGEGRKTAEERWEELQEWLS